VAIGFGAVAAAHVEVEAEGGAIAGQPAQLAFRVPNERDDATTVAIEIQLPQEVDLTDVVPADVEGWTVTTTQRDGGVVDTIRWDATAGGLSGDARIELPVAMGPLPAVAELAFPTVQTYDDGEVVRWIEPAPPGSPEPDFPVPVLAIAPAPPDATTGQTDPPATAPPTAAPGTEPPPTSGAPTQPVAPMTEAPEETAVAPTAATSDVVVATEPLVPLTPPATTADGGDGADAWPWVLGGILVALGVIGAIAIARRRRST
jgi:uncharacterized protein YcnI